MSDSSTEDEQAGSTSEDTQSNSTLPIVYWDKQERRVSARNWTFEVYDLHRFDWKGLSHKNCVYRICQKQSNRGYECYYGVMAFNTKVSYACIHNLIGGGDHCWIHPAYAPQRCRSKCSSKQFPGSKIFEWGTAPASYLGTKFNKRNFKQQQYRKFKKFRADNPHVSIKN